MTFLVRVLSGFLQSFYVAMVVILPCITSSRAVFATELKKPIKTVVVIHCDYPPVSFWDKNTNKPSGFFVDIMDKVAEHAGLQVGYICKNGWAEMGNAIESGEADLGALLKSMEREKTLLFSVPIDITYLSYFARSQSSIDADKVPEGYTVGVVMGSMSFEQLKNRLGENLLTYGSYQDGLFGLLSGEIGVFAGEESMILKRARETHLEDRIRKIGKSFLERERGLAVKKGNVQLLGLLDETLHGFTRSPEYQRIYLKWYGAPTPYWTNRRIFFASGLFLVVAVCGMALWRYLSIIRINKELIRNITDRKTAEEALQESEMRYRALFEQSGDYIIVMKIPQDNVPVITDMNEAALRAHGYSREEIVGRPITSLVTETHSGVYGERIKALEKGGLEMFTAQHRRRDGSLFDIEVRAQLVRIGFEQLILVSERDITRRKQTEDALIQSEKKYKFLVETTNTGFVIIDSRGCVLDANDEYVRLSGHVAQADILGRSVVEWTAEHHRELNAREVKKCLEQGFVRNLELDYVRQDGTFVPIEINANVIGKGKDVRIFSLCRDITERKQAEEAKDRMLKAISAVTEGIAITDAKDRFIYVNDAYAQIHGKSRDELIGKTWRDTVTPELVPLVERDLSMNLHNRAVGMWRGECPALRNDGTVVPIEVTATSRWDEMGHYLGHMCIVRDISDRKRTEEALIKKEKFIRTMLNTVDEGFIVIDRDFSILTANSAYCSQVGEPCDAVIGRHCYEISHKTQRPCYEEGEECAVRHVFETGEPHTALHRHPDAKGSLLYVETKAFPIKDSTGAVTSVIETVNNITEKHLLEEERLKTQKLEAIGTLAGGIAHDFNNLLQGVFGYISMAKLTLDRKERSFAMLSQAEQALHMSVNLATQLLTFSRGGKPLKKKIPLQPVIENSVRFALSGSNVDFRIKVDENLWMVEADEGQIGQVIQNIVLNADQAMPMGGTIVITARTVHAPHRELPALLAGGHYVEISVKDNGSGIPEQYLPRLFDPYFTTKEKGSGLGLTTSYSIIRNHDGLISVKTELGKGSTFFVYLAAVQPDEMRVGTVPATAEAVRKGRILVMDDEEVVRNIVGIMIGELGHEAELAGNGEEAVAKYREALSSARRFDIVILDLTIRGGMGGRETIERLLTIDPAVTAIVSSGYSDDAVVSDHHTYGFKTYLPKPYKLEDLRDTLNALLR